MNDDATVNEVNANPKADADRKVEFLKANNLLRSFLVQDGYLFFSQSTYITSTLVGDGESQGNGFLRQIGEQQKDQK